MHSSGTAEYALRLTSHRTDDALTITVAGDIDPNTVEPLQCALSAARTGPDARRTVVLDLSAVTFAGTSLINALLRARTSLGAERLRIVDPSPCVIHLMALSDLGRHFFPDAASAVPSAAAVP